MNLTKMKCPILNLVPSILNPVFKAPRIKHYKNFIYNFLFKLIMASNLILILFLKIFQMASNLVHNIIRFIFVFDCTELSFICIFQNTIGLAIPVNEVPFGTCSINFFRRMIESKNISEEIDS